MINEKQKFAVGEKVCVGGVIKAVVMYRPFDEHYAFDTEPTTWFPENELEEVNGTVQKVQVQSLHA